MKKSVCSLAVLGTLCGAAMAQSSVTISGSVDAGIRNVGIASGSGTDRDWQFRSSSSSYNNITFSGREDLGGGMTAFFLLQHRFNLGTGSSLGTTNSSATAPITDPFWRHSYVGLGSTAVGEVRLGRYFVPMQELNGLYDPFSVATVATVHTGGIAAAVRATNQIFYRTPNLGGFTLSASIAAAENQNQGTGGLGELGLPPVGYFAPTARLNSERPVGLAARYLAGPVDVGAAYDRNTADMKTAGLYAAYDFGVAKLMGQFEKGDNCTAAASVCTTSANGAEDIKAMSIGATMPLGAFKLKAGYLRINSDLANRDGGKLGLGSDYSLSKRTVVYADVAKFSGNRFSTVAKKAQFDLGMRHAF